MNNPWEAVQGRSGILAERLGQDEDLSSVFYRVLQGIYMLMVEKKVERVRITEVAAKKDQLIIRLDGKQGNGTTMELMDKRNKFMAKIYGSLPGVNDLILKMGRYCKGRSGIQIIQSNDRKKIILEGKSDH